jgi:lysophospholipase L1-like esterase
MTSADQATQSPPKRMKKRVGLGIALVMSVLLVEVVLRFVPIHAVSHDELVARYHPPETAMYVAHPYLAYTLNPGFQSPESSRHQVSINSAGFRGADVPVEKPEGELRIACFGGSSTFGAGPTRDSKTWPAQVERLLGERFPDRSIRVLNFGTPSWTSFESQTCLAIRALSYEPDVVLIYHAVNDTWSALGPDPQPDNRHTRKVWSNERKHPIDSALEWSMAYRIWRRYISGDVFDRRKIHTYIDVDVSTLDIEPPFKTQGFENFRRNLTSMIAMARAHGAKPALLMQATRPVDENNMPLLSGERPGRDPARFKIVQGILQAMQDHTLPVIGEVAAQEDVPLIDVRDHMEARARARLANGNTDRMYTDTVHVTNIGALLIAQYVADQLVELGLVD